MIIGFSKYGRGGGDGPVRYLTEGIAPTVGYLTAKSRRGVQRNPAPVILRGNPDLIRQVINRVPFKRQYVSGVLSFSEEKISRQVEEQIMDKFETVAFSGLPKDGYCILWVRHRHAGHHEMHWVSPAVELHTGKNFNLNPPRRSTREMFDIVRRLLNDTFFLTDPDDPSRARAVRIPSYLLKGTPTRDNVRVAIASYLEAKFRAGRIATRDDVLRLLREAGYIVHRVGAKYVTIVDQTGKHCRLKGFLFEQDFSTTPSAPSHSRLSAQERAQLEAKLARLVAARAEYNLRRYKTAARQPEPLQALPLPISERIKEPANDRIRTSFTERTGALEQRVNGSGSAFETTLERSREAARRRRRAASQLDRASYSSRLAGQSFEQTNRRLEQNLGDNLRSIERRYVTRRIFRKYAVQLARLGPSHDCVLELEHELYESFL